MQTTTPSAQDIAPLTRGQVAQAATAELAACLALLSDLGEPDWARPTDCAGWTVRDLAAHLVGQYQGLASPAVYLRRHYRAHRRHPALSRLDADNRQQIDDLTGRTGAELTAMLARIGPKAIRARHRVPGLVRRQHISRLYPEEHLPDDRLGYVLDVLGLRDPWMHRIDLARATGRPLPPGLHDHLIVTQVIADLHRAWPGPPALLELTGPAGGRWTLGNCPAAATIRADTVDYLRTLSGRDNHPALHTDGDPAAAHAAATARVPF
jgi:uncharacterized protein (TIGR03083 family)